MLQRGSETKPLPNPVRICPTATLIYDFFQKKDVDSSSGDATLIIASQRQVAVMAAGFCFPCADYRLLVTDYRLLFAEYRLLVSKWNK